MNQYFFQNPRPFVEPLRYDYANVSCGDFLAIWIDSRQKFIDQLKFSVGAEEIENDSVGNLSTILHEIALNKNYALLLKFVKKFEVFGRLYASYDDQHKKTMDATSACFHDYISFGFLLAEAAKETNNLQFLSSLLKLCDNFCSLKLEYLSSDKAKKLSRLLEQEIELIEIMQGEP